MQDVTEGAAHCGECGQATGAAREGDRRKSPSLVHSQSLWSVETMSKNQQTNAATATLVTITASVADIDNIVSSPEWFDNSQPGWSRNGSLTH